MASNRFARAWILIGAMLLVLTVGVWARRGPARGVPEDLRDAVAVPVSPALLGGARVIQPNAGYFASPAGRRAEAERALISTRRTKISRTTRARATKRREDIP